MREYQNKVSVKDSISFLPQRRCGISVGPSSNISISNDISSPDYTASKDRPLK